MTFYANAKLNLSLDITERRDDGYHNIVSEMQEIDLSDTVAIEINRNHDEIRVNCDNPRIPTDERNIAYSTAKLFLQTAGLKFGVDINIKKRIPLMAGLGGSSTDGATVLKGLNEMCDSDSKIDFKRYSIDELCKLGARLGADVPFCIVGGRAECRGIGDIITPLPDLPAQFYVIVQPDFYCDTKSAYELFAKRESRYGRKGTITKATATANIFQRLYNDERIERICEEMLNLGAGSASMTGSGSAVFGVFPTDELAENALERMNQPFKYKAKNVKTVLS
ncbi:MAG: 4-(cytidine 5'-diphospho)-2-C-methyl-D-erythritol kinase [Oscillospiraceae bacterium]|nr:4-(cytidine 5'-diphospho)-2-C-methyl-D-erythritol kinase [Oscillospiraceae bacterium]